ncbi:glycosyltransferase [Halorientalis pallida]|uniref:Glycosyltransferase n=1 Tax=Halorientalis pallida TaxID=2479928 RepID=A0A498KRT2_9EURY|nr:glycosyltransferase [Halorientalis pallida]RXK46941.1 glycosyltransferase [Halorientalis pallida]
MSDDVAWVFPAFGHSVNDEGGDFGHPSHRGFQRAIEAEPVLFPDADFSPVAGTFLEPYLAARKLDILQYDTFVLENADAVYATPFIRDQYPDATILLLAAHRMFGLESYDFSDDDFPTSILRPAERYLDSKIVRRLIRKHVDGVLTISEFVSEYVSEFVGDTPRRTVYPYVQPEFASELDALETDVDGCHAVTVCEARDHKGVDMLVRAWPSVRDRFPDATLDVIGDGHPDRYGDVPGISVRGFVEDLADEYRRADLYVHPARADAFGVTVIEAMRAGTPAIVTDTTGSRDVVSEIADELSVEPSENSLSQGICWYFERSVGNRRELAERAKRASTSFTEGEQLDCFGEKYDNLTTVI